MRMAIVATIVTALVAPTAGLAQQVTAEEALANAQGTYSADSVSRRCRPAVGDEIVVCADRGRDQRMPSTADSDPNSRAAREALDGGIPRAPNLGPRDIGGVKVAGCFLQKCPKPLYLVDVAALPQAPDGSDADLIAKGEKRAP